MTDTPTVLVSAKYTNKADEFTEAKIQEPIVTCSAEARLHFEWELALFQPRASFGKKKKKKKDHLV